MCNRILSGDQRGVTLRSAPEFRRISVGIAPIQQRLSASGKVRYQGRALPFLLPERLKMRPPRVLLTRILIADDSPEDIRLLRALGDRPGGMEVLRGGR